MYTIYIGEPDVFYKAIGSIGKEEHLEFFHLLKELPIRTIWLQEFALYNEFINLFPVEIEELIEEINLVSTYLKDNNFLRLMEQACQEVKGTSWQGMGLGTDL
jgi:hypothetical protein